MIKRCLGTLILTVGLSWGQASISFPTASSTSTGLLKASDYFAFTSKQNALGFTPENLSNKNKPLGYAGLDLNGKLPWIQISGIPIASATTMGCLLSTDWLLIHSAEQQSKKNIAGGYAGVGLDGKVLPALLPPPVPGPKGDQGIQGVIGQTGATGSQGPQGLQGPQGVQGIPGPLNFAKGWDTTVTYSAQTMVAFNGSSYMSLVDGNVGNQPDTDYVANAGHWYIAASGATGTPGATGAQGPIGLQGAPGVNGLPGPAGATGPQGPQGIPGTGSGPSAHQFNIASIPKNSDGTTNFQAAVNAAKVANNYSAMDSTNPIFGADVFIPSGIYHVKGPTYFPRPNQTSYPNGPAEGVVGIIGETPSSVVIIADPSPNWNGVTGAQLLMPGFNYVGITTVAFSGGGCTTEPVGQVILMAGTTSVAEVYTTSNGTGCTSMPSCTITGSGVGAQCEAVGHAIFEWEPIPAGTFRRTFGQRIMNIRFRSPSVPGTMAINFQITNAPNFGGGACSVGYANVCERMMNADLENLDFEDDNVYNPASIRIGGDCNTCTFTNLSNNPHLSTAPGAYQTPLIMTSYWVDSIGDEGDGLFMATLTHLACGGSKNGAAPCFVGRAIRSTFADLQCDGVRNGTTPAAGYAFYNSEAVTIQNASTEGTAGIQILIQNSKQFFVSNTGIGSGNAANNGIPAPFGLVLINVDESVFQGALASQTNFATNGGLRVSVDANSYKNQFFGFEIAGTNEVSIANLGSNYFQYCLVGSGCNGNSNWLHLGTSPF